MRALLGGYPDIVRDPTLRALFFVLLIGGTAQGMALAYTSVWASQTFGLGAQAVAFLYVVSGVVGAIGNPLIGLASDRLGRRGPFVVIQLVVCAAALVGYTLATSYAMALFLVAFAGFGVMGLALTMVGDVVRANPELAGGRGLRILSTERTAWAMGIIIGPASAAVVVSATGQLNPVFLCAAAIQLVAGVLAWRARKVAEPPGRPRRRQDQTVAPPWPRRRLVALTTLVVGLVFVALPSQTRNIYVPLFITQVLGESNASVGPAFTINATVAVIAMPTMGQLAERVGAQRVLYLGILVGFVYCALQSVAATYLATILIQMLIGLQISLWSTAGLIYLQQLLPDRAGIAGGLYLTVTQVTPIVSGLLLGPIAQTYGVPSAFSTTAALLILSALLLVPSHRALVSSSLSLWEGARVRA
jgi:SET family sugar efflux transporter-like MFS transporter